MKKTSLWFSLLQRYEYPGNVPCFYSSKDFEWGKIFDNQLDVIREELRNYLKKEGSPVNYFNYEMVNHPDAWKTIPLMSWGVHFYNHQRYFPKTYQLLQQIPGLVSISFNVLQPNSEIKPHFGDTNGMIRCHYGLKIPGTLPEIGFRVKEEEQSWKEGDFFAFCDGYTHTAWNHTNDTRIILIFDVILPEYLAHKKHICGSVLSSIFLQSQALRHQIKEPSLKMLKFIHFFTRNAAITLTPFYNLYSKIRFVYLGRK